MSSSSTTSPSSSDPISWFIFVQHGSHGMLRDFDSLSECIKEKMNHRAAVISREFESDNNKNKTNTYESNNIMMSLKLLTPSLAEKIKSSCESWSSEKRERLSRMLKMHKDTINLTIFGTKANEGLGTDQGTMKCVDKIMPELKKALLTSNTKSSSSSSSSSSCCYFSGASHSFGGLLSREVIKRLYEDKEIQFGNNGSSNKNSQNEKTFSSLLMKLTPVQFTTIASPHCGVNSIEFAPLRWGGRLLGSIYSSTYQELFVDSPLLKNMAGIRSISSDDEKKNQVSDEKTLSSSSSSSSYLDALTSFKDHLLVGAFSNDYLVRFETATCVPIGCIEELAHNNSCHATTNENPSSSQQHPRETFPKRLMSIKTGTPSETNNNNNNKKDENNTNNTVQDNRQQPSTHVGQLLEVAHNQDKNQTVVNFADSSSPPVIISVNKFQQLTADRDPIGLDLATRLHRGLKQYKVMPVFIPSSAPQNSGMGFTSLTSFINPQTFSIAHDALLRKGVSYDVLPDVVEAVAEEMVDSFFRQLIEDF